MRRFPLDALLAVLKFPFCVLAWLVWIVISLPLWIFQFLRVFLCVTAGPTGDPDDPIVAAMGAAARGWLGVFASIWQFFYGD